MRCKCSPSPRLILTKEVAVQEEQDQDRPGECTQKTATLLRYPIEAVVAQCNFFQSLPRQSQNRDWVKLGKNANYIKYTDLNIV